MDGHGAVTMVSIIIPSYNHARFLDETMASVLGQTFDDIEVLVVDDASTDNSVEVLTQWARRDSRLRLVRHESNRGISRTLNEGLSRATGEFVAFVDSDDLWHATKLERQVEVARIRDGVAVWTDGLMIGPDGKVEGSFVRTFNDERYPPSGWLFKALLRGNLVTLQTVLIPRSHLHGITFDERIALLSDYTFLIDVSRRCEFVFIPEVLAHFRLHGANTTFTRRELWSVDASVVREDVLARYGEELSPAERAQFAEVTDRFAQFATAEL